MFFADIMCRCKRNIVIIENIFLFSTDYYHWQWNVCIRIHLCEMLFTTLTVFCFYILYLLLKQEYKIQNLSNYVLELNPNNFI